MRAANIVERREAGDCSVAVHDMRHKGASGRHQPDGRPSPNKEATARNHHSTYRLSTL